jgi:hypothetical protein
MCIICNQIELKILHILEEGRRISEQQAVQ